MSSRTRLEDLASIAGVSIATVSRALNNSPAVNDETKRRVWKLAREHNYHFRPSMPAMLSSAVATVAVVIPIAEGRQESPLHPFVHDFIGGVADAARGLGCDVLISYLMPDQLDDLSMLMTANRADGVVFLGQRVLHERLNRLAETETRFVAWGADLPGEPRLGDLVRRILKLTSVPRLRISSIDSIEADPALIEAIAAEPRLMPHLHLSLQAGDDLILKRMKRRHLRDDAIRFCEDVRRLRPDMIFGADIIAGFPTETEAMFQRSLDLVQDCGLTFLHVFPFSPRKGTPAARMPQVRGPEIKDRAARLRAAGDQALARHLTAQIGQTHRVLTEGPRLGRTEQFTEVAFATDQPEGALLDVTVKGQDGTRLMA